MATQAEVNGLGSTRVIVPPGATLAVVVNPVAGGCNQRLKYLSGGSLEIFNCPVGTTAPGGSLVALATAGGYLMSTTEIVEIDGPARYYLMATGATAIAALVYGLTAGY